VNWNERAKAVLAQGCTTYSKRADQYIEGVYPTHITSWDEAEEGDHEHVTTWAKRTIGHNGFKSYVFPADFTAKLVGKLSVDTPEDLERLRKIMEDQNART